MRLLRPLRSLAMTEVAGFGAKTKLFTNVSTLIEQKIIVARRTPPPETSIAQLTFNYRNYIRIPEAAQKNFSAEYNTMARIFQQMSEPRRYFFDSSRMVGPESAHSDKIMEAGSFSLTGEDIS